jgi:hypothetical protein
MAKHQGYSSLFWYLLFGGWHDKESSRLLLCSETISQFEGRSVSNTRAERFLIRFRDEVLPKDAVLRWSGWREGHCRQLVDFHLGAFHHLLEKEYARQWHDSGRVYLDGSAYTTAKHQRMRHAACEIAWQRSGLCADAQSIQAYLNGLPSHLFTRAVRANLQRARAAAYALEDKQVAAQQERILRHIESQPQPFYAATDAGNTVRLFTSEAIPNLERSVRQALSRGWVDADLNCSQLAICAWLWNVADVQDFLRGGENF